MPSTTIRWLYQRAVLFPFVGVYDAFGQPTLGVPVEIPVRWITKRREILDKHGNTIALDASADVAQTIKVDSVIWLGTLANWNGTGSGLPDTELMMVKSYDETPDGKGRSLKRNIGMMRYRNVVVHA